MRIVLGIVFVLLLAIGGGALGFVLKPEKEASVPEEPPEPEPLPEPEYVSLTREFVVPMVADGRVRGHVVLTLGLHSETVTREQLLRLEPIFRDRLLEALFRHASAGGFDAQFTSALNLNRLRTTLNEAASSVIYPSEATVLVTSIDRRDL